MKVKHTFKIFDETGRYFDNPTKDYPNIKMGENTYTLTDEYIIQSWEYTISDEYHYNWEIVTGSTKIAHREVRDFLLEKFDQAYLDYLLGSNVATLTKDYQKSHPKQKVLSFKDNK